MQTRDQKYAIDVYKRVEDVAKMSKEERTRYGSMAHKLPILIRTAGLAQALTFVAATAQKKEIYKRLLNDIAVTIGKQGKDALLTDARGAGIKQYMYLTKQVMAALLWYKRFAQSILDVEGPDQGDNA